MEHYVIQLAGLVALGVGATWLAWRVRVPSILLLLMVGFLAGPVTGILQPDTLLGDLLVPIVSLSVAVILFEGGLSLDIDELRDIGRVVRNLMTVGVLVTWVGTTALAHLLLGFDLGLATLLGAILVVTGPTVIIPLLRHVRPSARVGSGPTIPSHLRGRFLYAPGATHQAIAARVAAGAVFKQTTLSEEFGFDDFQSRHGDTALLMFVSKGPGDLEVIAAESTRSPKAGHTLISLVGPDGQVPVSNSDIEENNHAD